MQCPIRLTMGTGQLNVNCEVPISMPRLCPRFPKDIACRCAWHLFGEDHSEIISRFGPHRLLQMTTYIGVRVKAQTKYASTYTRRTRLKFDPIWNLKIRFTPPTIEMKAFIISLLSAASAVYASPLLTERQQTCPTSGITTARAAEVLNKFRSARVIPDSVPGFTPTVDLRVKYGNINENLGNTFNVLRTSTRSHQAPDYHPFIKQH